MLNKINPIKKLGISLFFEMQVYLLPFSLIFYEKNGLSVSDFFLFQSIFFFVSLFLEIPTGYISDLISRKYIILLSYLFNCLRLFLYLFFSGYYVVLAGEICYAFCKSFLSGATDSYVYDYLQQQTHSQKMLSKYGKTTSMMSFGTAFASLTSAFIYNAFGIQAVIIVEFITALIGIFFALSIPKIAIYKKKSITIKELFTGFRFIRTSPQLLYFILFAGLCFSATSLFATSFQPTLKAVSAPAILFSIVYFFNHLTRGISSRFSKEFTKYLSTKQLLFITMCLVLLSFLCFWGDSYITTIPFVLCSLAIACISISFHLVIQVIAVSNLHQVAPNHLRATCSSVMNMLLKMTSGFLLFLFKDSRDLIGSPKTYLIFGCLFLVLLAFLYNRICSFSKNEELSCEK